MTEPIRPLLVLTLIGMAGWAALALALWSLNHPHDVTAAPATTDLGPEPPGVAALLTSGFRVPTEAVPATLLDLAARGFVEIMLVAGGHHLVRLTGKRGELTDYERYVLTHVERIAVRGIVPAQALATGPRAQSRLWWFRFREAVIADAQTRGLSTNRWSASAMGALWLAALGLGALFIVAIRFQKGNIGFDLSGAVFGLFWPMASILLRVSASRSQRDTPKGLVVAARWLGVRAGLAKNESFRTLPPSATQIWERHLAYAAAMGLASHACAQLPLGAEDDHLAWSSFAHRWRKVRVSYPRWPWWGGKPTVVAAAGAAAAVPSLWLLAVIWRPEMRVIHGTTSLPAGIRWIALAFGVVVATVAAGAVAAAVQGFADLATQPRTIAGAVVRLRAYSSFVSRKDRPSYRYFAAIDDGTSDRLMALSIPEDEYAELRQGQLVKVRISPRLGCLLDAEPWTPARATSVV